MRSHTPHRFVRVALVSLLLVAVMPPAALGAGGGVDRTPTGERATDLGGAEARPYVDDELIVRFDGGASAVVAAAAHSAVGAEVIAEPESASGLVVVALPEGTSVESAIASYEAMPDVAYAEPNYLVGPAASPNDPLYPSLWGLDNTGQTVDGVAGTPDADIDGPEAWDISTGGASVLVAVIDSGVDYNHPNLAGSMWVNSAELAGSAGVDDDGNGYIDDIHGYDTLAGDGDPADEYGHGTAVASVIAAQGNDGAGTVGVAWDASIMAVRFISDSGVGTVADAIEAYEYAHSMGADVINNSWGGWRIFSQAEYDTIAAMSDTLFVCAAGNDGLNIDATWPGGVTGGRYYGARTDWRFYPAAYDLGNILTVGASDSHDAKAGFSNAGATAVDVFAPGTAVVSATLRPRTLAADAIENVLFAEDFTTLDLWWAYRWALDSSAYVSAPSSAARLGYLNNQIAVLDQTTLLDLSAADYPALRFQVRYDLEAGPDYFTWGIYDPAVTADPYVVLGTLTGSSGGAFEEVVYDLGEHAGRSDVFVWFGLYSNGSISSVEGYDGVWLDDVQVLDLDAGVSGSPWTESYTTAYDHAYGTSVAAAHASGTAVLLLALDPTLDAAQVKSAILGSVDTKAGLTDICVSDGRINAHTAVTAPIALGETVGGVEQLSSPAGVTPAAVGAPVTMSAPGVLANDTDPNADAITAHLLTGPQHGSLVLAVDGGFTYTPEPDFFGTDTFVYRVKDAGGSYSAPAMTSIQVIEPAGTDVSVYRFYSGRSGTHFYTSSEAERDDVIARLSATYTFEGTAYTVNTATAPTPLHRFYNAGNGSHFYTASASEAALVIDRYPTIYSYEGETYPVALDAATGLVPVHRFYNLRNGSHFYTASESEKDSVIASLTGAYTYEGIAYYVTDPMPDN